MQLWIKHNGVAGVIKHVVGVRASRGGVYAAHRLRCDIVVS